MPSDGLYAVYLRKSRADTKPWPCIRGISNPWRGVADTPLRPPTIGNW